MILREEPQARFSPGTLVRHRRYGYRGVVVESDPECRASGAWYASNQTQPRRDQPWYHVLVHGASHATYVAEENLLVDPSAEPILHPLLEVFFEGPEDGRYRRNAKPWRGA